MTNRLLLLAALVIGGCGEYKGSAVSNHSNRLHDIKAHYHFTIDGMPCVAVGGGLTCDWSKYRQYGELYSDHEIAHGAARASINKAFAEIDELRSRIGEGDE